MIFLFFKKIMFLGILGPPYCGIGATIRIGREMRCLPYAGFFFLNMGTKNTLMDAFFTDTKIFLQNKKKKKL